MRLYEILFAAVCGILCAGALWCAAGIADEPFYVTICAFLAAFWGALAAFCIWGRICEQERRDEWKATIIYPTRRT